MKTIKKYTNRGNKILLIFLFTIIFTGCGITTGSKIEKPNGLQMFEYNYGSFNDGEWNFKIIYEKNKYLFTAVGYNGVDIDTEKYVSQDVIEELERIIISNNILSWNGFDNRDQDILDGYGFRLRVEYYDDTVISACGYEKYPKNYQKGHTALSDYLISLTDNKGKPSDLREESLFEYINPGAVEFAKNFEIDFPISVSVSQYTVAGGTTVETKDQNIIRAVFNALHGITILGEGEPEHTDDHLIYTFIMEDGREFTFSFQQGCLLVRHQQIEINGFNMLTAALNVPAE